ncbi:MAG: hypothetical protein ACFCU6_11480, partial [Balneolaceae bacterium]
MVERCCRNSDVHKVLLHSGFLILLLTGCHGNLEYDEKIDYGSLNLIDIQIAMEIGESSEYLPGELGDLVVFSDKTMLVADWRKMTIEQFSADGEHMATIAREGRGPGELLEFFMLHEGVNDTLIVRYLGMSQQIDLFTRGENQIYRHIKSWIPERFRDRMMITIAPRSETEYYARESWNNHQVRSMIADGAEYGWVPVAIVDAYENVLVDSLHMLKTPTSVARMSDGGALTILGWPPYQASDQFRVMKNNRYVIARSDSSALFIYNSKHELERSIPLKVKDRPIKKADLDFLFELRSVSEDVRRELETRVPDVKPVFLNLWVSEEYFWLHVDTK